MGNLVFQPDIKNEMVEKLVSVIVPIYQSEAHLRACLNSIVGQTYPNLEILLIDDGSEDHSNEICREFAQQDSRIRLFCQQNKGVSSARNAGISRMQGEFVMFVDADDLIDPVMVEEMVRIARQTRADLVLSGFKMIFEDGSPEQDYRVDHFYAGSRDGFVARYMVECYDKLLLNTQCNKLCSTAIFKKYQLRYREEFAINEDALISIQMVRYSRRIACIRQPFYHYRQYSRPQSLVTKFNSNGVESCCVLTTAVWDCLKSARANGRVVNAMNNRMLFHICGFAGLAYYRSDYPNCECLAEVGRLAGHQVFRRLLKVTRPSGPKQAAAYLLVRPQSYYLYHLLCLLGYHKKRKLYRRKKD